MELLIATGNAGKLQEYRELLADMDRDITVVSPDDVGLTGFDVEETGTTFEENARLKAEAYARASQRVALADDSGLVVDALDGRPGVYSARYGGPGLNDAGRRQHLLHEMQEIADAERSARFVCVIAVHDPRRQLTETVRGTCEGMIVREERDAGYGFGYDPLFQPDGYTYTFAELSPEVKHQISHRGQATQHLPALLRELVPSTNDGV